MIEIPIDLENQILFFPNYLNNVESDFYFETFLKEIEWKHEEIKLFGKKIFQPRLTAFYGEKEVSYAYSGIKMDAKYWTPNLNKLRNKINTQFYQSFNSCLMNLYRNENDSMGWHQDNEKELGENPFIASLSLGETRKFQLKKIDTNEKFELNLSHGSLLIMKNDLQNNLKHQIPKEKTVKDKRINITFRKILNVHTHK